MSISGSDHWKALKKKVLQGADLLLQVLASKNSDKAAFTESFTQYAELWQEIANDAYGYGLEGLCDVCMLFHASALDADMVEEGLGDKHGQLLEKWQTLFLAYLDAPETDSTSDNLVRYLQEPLWVEPLDDDDVDMLKQQLLPEITISEEQVKETPLNEGQEGNDNWNNLKKSVLKAASPLQQLLTAEQENDPSELADKFTLYAELWQDIANEAYGYGFEGLCDVCMVFHASALDADLVEQGLSDKHGQLLEKWSILFIAYLDAPELDSNCENLARFLQESMWAEPLDDDDVDMLKQQLLPETAIVEESEKNIPSVEEHDESDSWGVLKTRVLETAASLQQVLEDHQKNNHSALKESFAQYAELWENIANEAYGFGLESLCDVCMLFHAVSLDVDLLEQGLSDKHVQLLEKWPELFIAYIDNPEIESNRDNLIHYLQEEEWTESLPDEDADELKKMLLPELVDDQTEEIITEIAVDPVDDGDLEQLSEASDIEEDSAPLSTDKITIAPDMLALIRTEFEPYAESIFVALDSDYAKTLDAEKFKIALMSQLDELEMLSKVSDTLGVKGLQKVFEVLHDNMQALCSNKLMLEDAQAQLLKKTMSGILHYIDDIDDVSKYTQLAEHLQSLQWPIPLVEGDVQDLISLFSSVSLQSREEIIGTREIASIEDVSLIIQDDVNPELLESLFSELPSLTEEFSGAVQQLLETGNVSDVETAQRIAHTLKGSGNLVGLTGVATLTHNIEDIMEKVALHGSVPKGVFDTLLLDCADCLEAMSDHVLGRGSAPDNALILLQQLLDLAYQIKAEGMPESIDFLLNPIIEKNSAETVHNFSMPPVVIDAEAKVVDKIVDAPAEPNSDGVETTTRIPSSLVEDMLRMAGENNILTGQIQQRLRETIEQNKSMDEQNSGLLNLIAELEQLVEEQGSVSQDISSSSTLDEDFDPLEMDQYNELHTCANRLLESATDARTVTSVVNSQLSELKDLLIVQERLQKENHELVLQTRMVPVQSIVSRLQRTVRQASRSVGKKVELHIIGSDTLIDRDILNSLIDSLMHLLRNAVDHGIESGEQRLSAGKSETGNITLEFALHGARIIIVCQDDGGGLDLLRIREIAEQKKLITADQSLSEKEIQRLVLEPGFSTRDSVTQLSGRGIGMNAVHDQILKLKGELDLDSQFGSGSRVELALPATLVSVRALLVRSGNQLIAVSNRGLEQILYPGAGKLKKLGNDLAYQYGQKLYSADKFERIINISNHDSPVIEANLSAMLFKMEAGNIKAILVEQVVDSRELVVKNMGKYVPKIHGIAGATILGDGSVTPVLDIPELLRENSSNSMLQLSGQDEKATLNRRGHRHALVIDDSLSARRSLALLLSDMDYDVSTAIDGIDAIEKMEEKLPDVILVDLEMPRMNGIELTSHVRNRVDTKDIPIIMVTSRATEKHRQQAEASGVSAYLTKPFSENEMMDQINKVVGGVV